MPRAEPLNERVNGPRPIRVLFLFERAENWLNVHRLWRVMREDARFEPNVWIVPPAGFSAEVTQRQIDRCLAACRAHDVPYELWTEGRRLEAGAFDVAVFNLPYDFQRPAELYFDAVASKVRATVYVPYGMATGDGAKSRRMQYGQATQRRADLIISRSHWEKRAYRRFCPSGDAHVAVLGLPRLDELYGLERFPVDPALKERVGGRVAFLWNSHYSFPARYAASANYSTFDVMAEPLLAYAAAHPDIALIWRPHPHLFGELVTSGIFTAEELTALRAEVDRAGVILDERPDYRHSFAISNALLTDSSSFLIEYLATGNPVVYLRNGEGVPLNEEAEALLRYYDVAESGDEVIAFIERLVRDGDKRRAERLAARAIFLPMFDGLASERVAERIASLCGRASAATIDAGAFPLLGRLMAGLSAIRQDKQSQAAAAKALNEGASAARVWLTDQVKQHPVLMKGISGMLHRLGVRRTSQG